MPAPAATVLHTFDGVAISPAGGLIASVDGIDTPGAMIPPELIVRTAAGRVVARFAACSASRACTIASPVWSGDGKRIVFVRTDFVTHRSALESVSPAGGLPHDILSFAGQLQAPLFMPGRTFDRGARDRGRPQAGRRDAGRAHR